LQRRHLLLQVPRTLSSAFPHVGIRLLLKSLSVLLLKLLDSFSELRNLLVLLLHLKFALRDFCAPMRLPKYLCASALKLILEAINFSLLVITILPPPMLGLLIHLTAAVLIMVLVSSGLLLARMRVVSCVVQLAATTYIVLIQQRIRKPIDFSAILGIQCSDLSCFLSLPGLLHICICHRFLRSLREQALLRFFQLKLLVANTPVRLPWNRM